MTESKSFNRTATVLLTVMADSAIHSFQISNKRKTVSTLTTDSLNLRWNGLDLSLKRFQADR